MLFRLFRDSHEALVGADAETRREARTQLIGISLSMMAHAGIKGTWGFGILMTLLGLFMGGDDDDAEEWLHNALLVEGESLGATAWNWTMGAALNGIPGFASGTDLSERIGLPNLWFRDDDYDQPVDDWWKDFLLGLGGPTIGLTLNVSRAWGQAQQGDTQRAAETVAPTAARNLIRAWRYGTEGVETRNGDTLLPDAGLDEVIKQGLGFMPAAIAERYEQNTRMANREREVERWREDVLDTIAESVAAGRGIDEAARAAQMEFNRAWPLWAVTPETIERSLRTRAQRRAGGTFGLEINDKLDRTIRAEQPPLIFQ